ncbi:protein PAIR1 isoform X1 [Amborella trichopoda]|uniref:Protein PAIR1 n=2 Tax=Amborella trichopoda TaxID=13333 RepID=W1NHP5_AMBTC|nr:protein PAIR1 isoform X1 [Amborella trichopoda]XP_020524756.1 protein PAIR1 isoform X1 [Amborella trichopoda]ERM95011.1 hypothetical protein AMTR_s00009p00236740 [Amborella trichopoda]|eukprot:XP_006827595.1 protein PAIR1 isoform X1 [Amborella trichopoda]
MKLRMNKACDLSSISVLPPHSRRSNPVPANGDSSIFSKAQAPQLRKSVMQSTLSQSQQSYSQGMLSQLSQNSQEEMATYEQRFSSQERDNSMKRISCLAPITCSRDESSQLALTRSSSSNMLCGWNSSSVPDHRFPLNEDLEPKIGAIDVALNKLGMVLDSVQSDVMQVNKTVKEVSLEMEDIRKKLIVQDNTLHLLLKDQEGIKSCLDGNLKTLPDQVRKESALPKLEEMGHVLKSIPDQIEMHLSKIRFEICANFTKEMQAMRANTKPSEDELPIAEYNTSSNRRNLSIERYHRPQRAKTSNHPAPAKVHSRSKLIPKTEPFTSKQFKSDTVICIDRRHQYEIKKEALPTSKESELRIIIDSDEEVDGGLNCLFGETETGRPTASYWSCSIEEAKEETRRMLRKARMRKRKHQGLLCYID